LRAHFAAVKFPMAGDDWYGGVKRNERLQRPLRIARPMLQAAAVEFAHPTAEKTGAFEAPLPSDLRPGLEKLRGER
jgi:23S rRNA-/tRNA-specific pseudouridylate synthase